MRTNVTLDADVAALLRLRMRQRDQHLDRVLNEALREALARDDVPRSPATYETPTFDLGGARIDLDHARRW